MATKISPLLHRHNFLLHLQERPDFECQVLIKEPASDLPTSSQIAQLHNEYVITRQLSDVPGVRPVYAKEGSESHPFLLLEYIQGQTLSELIQAASLDLSEKLQNAIEIAGILSRIHEQQVMHKDINPSNILVAEDGGVYIIDFGIASNKRQEHLQRTSVNDGMLGSLAYISPEQTGRMNRHIDFRTDFYSLGVTLYKLFTGQLPFQSDDALEMIHSHIARVPIQPAEINGDIPLPISDIILKLLAKNAEDRYQSARGLQADLRYCLEQLQATDQVEPFDLGRDDFIDRLQIPQKLYGRQAEIDQLLIAFNRVTQGDAELLLVAGYAGVGKTSLVHEIHKPITAKRGYLIQGKFDQYQRTIPYYAWVQAFSELVNNWLVESETDIDQWRAMILEAVGEHGQVLIEIIPNLELIIGPQPDVIELDATATKNRFSYIFQRFVMALATPDHPLVIFLDDLQWIDLASLNLLKMLLSDPDSGYFMVIGAYRDNEVDATHSLMLGINDLEKAGVRIKKLSLGNLGLSDINQLLSDCTNMSSDQCLPLAQLVQAKTAGNAFFTHQLLHELEDNGLLAFDQNKLCWGWDLAILERMPVSDNVVDLMVNKIQKLPVDTQEVLKIASCLGNQFELTTLNLISSQSQENTQQALQVAYQEGLVVELNENTRFVHDRVQQAAYSLIPEPELAPLHWQIGQTMLRETPPQSREERLFELVDQLNLGSSLIKTDAEWIELAELNLEAAHKALQAIAYAGASAYAQKAIDLLTAEGWQTHYRLTLNLHQLAAEAAYLNLDFEHSQQYIAAILAQAQSLIDRMPAYIIQIRLFHTQNLIAEAIETGLAVLDELGLPLLESEPAGVSVQAISELAPMTDPQASAAAELLDSLLLPAHVFKPKLLPSLTYTALRLNLQFGWHPSSCMIAMAYAVFVWPEDIDKAHRFGQLALQLSERPEAYRYLCQVRAGVNAYISPWKSHYRTIEQALRDTVQIGLDIGDKAYAMSSLVNSSILNIFLRDRLDQAQENMTQDIHLLQGSGEQFNLYSLLVWTQLVVNLRGRSNDPLCFEGPHFDEASDLPLAQAAGLHQTTIFLHLLKLILHYHLGHFQAAFAYSEEAELFLPNFRSYYLIPLHPFYQSLAILQLPDRQGQPAKLVEKIEQNLQKLQLWAQHAPMNHQHKVDLILAEQARVAGDIAAAMDHYEAAIAGAKDNEYLHEEALANELYGRFWIERGKDHFAEKFIHEAHALYSRWGAGAIVEYLEAQYPQWLKVKSIDTGPLRPSIDIKELQVDLDLQTVIKASQAIASELELDRLLGILMDIVLKNSGAQQSLLLWEQEGEWVIQAAVAAGQSHPQAMQAIRLSDFDGVAHSIVHYVARTQKTVILGDAAHTGQFVQDPYLQRRQVKSLLCMPLLNQRQSNGILYLENNLAADVFTPDRVALLDVLSSQMSISLDNALLYDQLKNLLSEQTEALKNSENQVQTLFENTPLGIALIDHEGGFLAFNQSLVRMLGYSEAETQKLNMTSLYHGPGQGTEILEKLQTSATVRNFGVEVVRKDGTSFYASLNASKLSQSEQDIYLAVIEDVSERIRAQQALQESQLRLANIIETAQEAVLTVNEDQKLTLFNPAAERMFGFERNDIVGRPLDVLLPERFRTEHADHIHTFAQTNVTARSMGNLGNLWGRRANGEEFPIEVSISQVKLANERLYTAFVQDVTERKKAEQALQERIKELNFLYSVSELVDRLWPALEEILQGAVELIPAAWQYPEITCARIVLKDQEFRTENFAVSPWQQTTDIIVFGEQTGTVEVYYLEERPESQEGIFLSEERSLIKEISERLGRTIERVMMEDALQESEEKYRDLVENISDVIYTIDTEGKITYISPAVESSLEYKPAEILGQSFLQFFSISSLDRGKENYQQLIHGKSPGPNEYQMQTKSGEIRWGQTSSKPILDGEDQVVGVQGVMTDITERKMLEAQMQELATLEERNRIARELHDSVTQSLYSINLQSDATLMALSSGKTESAERRLQMLKDTAQESMAEMRLLIYELHPSILEEAGLVAALKQRLETVELRSGVEVDLQIEGEQRLPIAVEYELFKISLEGLNNVLKHAKAKEVLVQVSFEHNRCRLTIKDNGMGFDHGNIGRYGGNGLANIKDRVEQIGGELTVITEPGKGTTLEVEVLYE